MEKTKALSQCKDLEGTMELNSHVLEDKLVDEQYYVIDHGEPQAILITDASTTTMGGYGAQMKQNTTLITLTC